MKSKSQLAGTRLDAQPGIRKPVRDAGRDGIVRELNLS
jgi:hypothetical protein